MFETPIVIIIFNRPQFAQKQYELLKDIKPKDLFIISDGARDGVNGENEKVNESRKVFDSIEWECNVHRDYAPQNQGCDKRIKSGLDRVFSETKKAIVLEDDCVPNKSFFYYCDELLTRYQNDESIKYISGSNQIIKYPIKDSSYIFTRSSWTLGWATWARAWNEQKDIIEEPEKYIPKIKGLKYISNAEKRSICNSLIQYKKTETAPWDINFVTSSLITGGLSIVPKENLVIHLGFDENATHVSTPFKNYEFKTVEMKFPLTHPKAVTEAKGYHKAQYHWMVEPLYKKLLSTDFYKRQFGKIIHKIWK